jgi:RNA polymerase sigma factor (sigma-70 family)
MMVPEPDEYELAQRARDGDREALAELVERTRMRLFALAYAELRHYDDAQDAVAAALLQIVRHVHELREPERVHAWMHAVVRNEVRRLRRRDDQRPTTNDQRIDQSATEPRSDGAIEAPSLLRLDIERALRRLPGDQAWAMRMFYLGDLSVREIALRLGRTEGTIKSWLHRGRRQLASEMEGYAPMTTATAAPSKILTRTAAIVHTDLDATLIQQVSDALQEVGYTPTVIAPENVSDLPETLKGFDCVVLGERIGRHTAFELLIHLRSDPATSVTPICVLCADPPGFTIASYWGAGVNRLINTKDPRDLARLSEAFRYLHFSRFTQAVESALHFLAQEEAGRLGAEAVDTEHLLLAITYPGHTLARQVLERLGVTREVVEAEVAKLKQRGQESSSAATRFAPAAMEAMDRSWDEAQALSHPHIGTEHVLLGLLRDARGKAARVLKKLGVTRERVLEALQAGTFRVEPPSGLSLRRPEGPIIVQQPPLTQPEPQRGPIPDVLPLLPIRDKVYLPNMIFPLFVGRAKTVAALREAAATHHAVFLVAQRQMYVDEPTPDDLYTMGVTGRVLQLLELPDGSIRVMIEAVARARITEYLKYQQTEPFFEVRAETLPEPSEPVADAGTLAQEAEAALRAAEFRLLKIPREAFTHLANLTNVETPEVGKIADTLTPYLPIPVAAQQEVLETLSPRDRLRKLIELLK